MIYYFEYHYYQNKQKLNLRPEKIKLGFSN